MKPKQVLLLVVVLTSGAIGLLCGGAAVVWVAFRGTSQQAISSEDKLLLVTADQLAAYHPIPGDRQQCESYLAKRNLDGSRELEYAYDTDLDPESSDYLYLKSEAEQCDSLQQAQESYRGRIQAYEIGIRLVAGRTLRPQEQPVLLGEECYLALVLDDDQPLGHVVVARQGKTVYSLLLFGVQFEDVDPLTEMLRRAMR